ncbi:hypothetical protein QTO34_017978 [Cnephaeus nilssonii]|uniref:Uncharacterized protein n=1 Tax=Cnephaeus nilssonii TaxID=3371016 RepID=A0AA40LRR9_CNENI|nr:hypothetical protein QTO34_017978 [Eptesicus nilssonii]
MWGDVKEVEEVEVGVWGEAEEVRDGRSPSNLIVFSFHPEGKDFVDVLEYLMDPRNKEKLQHLLSDESWERFVAGATLSRDKADALYADLSQLEALMAVEDKDMPSADQLHGESFMKEFPQVKQDLEDRITKLYALADEVDKVHRDCAITKVTATTTGVVSGILTIAGLSLAPVTAGLVWCFQQLGWDWGQQLL